MKIGINASFVNLNSGIATYTYNLIENLRMLELEEEFHFFLSRKSFIKELFDAPNYNAHTYNIPEFNSLRKVFWEHFKLPREIKKTELDVFHSPAFISPKGLKVPSIITFQDMVFKKFPDTIKKTKLFYYDKSMTRSVKEADKIITSSQFTKTELIDFYGVSGQKIVVTPFAVSKKFSPLNDENSLKFIQKKFEISKPYLLFVGTIEPRKNIKRIVEAFAELNSTEHELVIAGSKGWMYDEIFQVIEKYNLQKNVIFAGKVDENELQLLYSNCEALLFPTLYEGFGLPILEAMACGAPVITSNCASMPEVAGDAALLVDPLETGEITNSIEKILGDSKLRDDLITQGLERVKEFSWKKCAEETMNVYKEFS